MDIGDYCQLLLEFGRSIPPEDWLLGLTIPIIVIVFEGALSLTVNGSRDKKRLYRLAFKVNADTGYDDSTDSLEKRFQRIRKGNGNNQINAANETEEKIVDIEKLPYGCFSRSFSLPLLLATITALCVNFYQLISDDKVEKWTLMTAFILFAVLIIVTFIIEALVRSTQKSNKKRLNIFVVWATNSFSFGLFIVIFLIFSVIL